MKSTSLGGVSDRSIETASRKQKMSCCYSLLRETTREVFSCKEIKPVNPKRNQPCIFIERAEAEAETPVFWPPGAKRRLTGKDLDAGED